MAQGWRRELGWWDSRGVPGMSVKVGCGGKPRMKRLWIWSRTGQDFYTYDWGTEEEQRARSDWGWRQHSGDSRGCVPWADAGVMHRHWMVSAQLVMSHYVGRGCGARLEGAGETQPHRCCSPLCFGEEWAAAGGDGWGHGLARLHGTWARGPGARPCRQMPLGMETGRGQAAPPVSTPAEQQTDTDDCALFHWEIFGLGTIFPIETSGWDRGSPHEGEFLIGHLWDFLPLFFYSVKN